MADLYDQTFGIQEPRVEINLDPRSNMETSFEIKMCPWGREKQEPIQKVKQKRCRVKRAKQETCKLKQKATRNLRKWSPGGKLGPNLEE